LPPTVSSDAAELATAGTDHLRGPLPCRSLLHHQYLSALTTDHPSVVGMAMCLGLSSSSPSWHFLYLVVVGPRVAYFTIAASSPRPTSTSGEEVQAKVSAAPEADKVARPGTIRSKCRPPGSNQDSPLIHPRTPP